MFLLRFHRRVPSNFTPEFSFWRPRLDHDLHFEPCPEQHRCQSRMVSTSSSILNTSLLRHVVILELAHQVKFDWQSAPGFHVRNVVVAPTVQIRFCILNHVDDSTRPGVSNTVLSICRQEFFQLGPHRRWHALGFSFFSFLHSTRQGSRHVLRQKSHWKVENSKQQVALRKW